MLSLHRSSALVVTYLVVTFPIAAVWHLALFPDAYAAAALRAQPIIPLGFLSTVLQAIVVAYAFPRLSSGGPPVREGVRFGLVMGTFMGSYGVLAEAAKFEVGSVGGWLVYEGMFFALQWLVIGIAVALVDAWVSRRISGGAVSK